MFEKRGVMELCRLISLMIALFCIVNAPRVKSVKLDGSSIGKSWTKSASQQPFRHMHMRGFRPESLSTARGFGKRASSIGNYLGYLSSLKHTLYPLNQNFNNILEHLRLADSLYSRENPYESKDYLANGNLYRDDVNKYIGLSNLNTVSDKNVKRLTFESDENVQKPVNDDEISNIY